MALAMAVAGVTHWVNPTPFLQHLPPWLPRPDELIFATGVIEVALGAALLLGQPWRRYAGYALAAYLVAVFPGNVYVAVTGVDVDGQPGGAYPWLRLPLQLLFIGWALWSTHTRRPRARGQNLPGRASAQEDGEDIPRNSRAVTPHSRAAIPQQRTSFTEHDQPSPFINDSTRR